jgi:hypothetical protein
MGKLAQSTKLRYKNRPANLLGIPVRHYSDNLLNPLDVVVEIPGVGVVRKYKRISYLPYGDTK